MSPLKLAALLFLLLVLLPIAASALQYHRAGIGDGWWDADRSSAGLLPPAAQHRPALVRVFAAPTVRWRGIVAVHCWLVVKPEGAAEYTRYDYTAWGEPIRVNGFAADGRWFGRLPDIVFAADGDAAARLIPTMQQAIRDYAWRNRGDYRAWPGPNSNTFVAAVLQAAGAEAALPPNAIGKDFPHDGRWLRITASRTGFSATLAGYAGITFALVEGIEINLLGLVVGVDLMHPALKLPAIGRLGLPHPATETINVTIVTDKVSDAAPSTGR